MKYKPQAYNLVNMAFENFPTTSRWFAGISRSNLSLNDLLTPRTNDDAHLACAPGRTSKVVWFLRRKCQVSGAISMSPTDLSSQPPGRVRRKHTTIPTTFQSTFFSSDGPLTPLPHTKLTSYGAAPPWTWWNHLQDFLCKHRNRSAATNQHGNNVHKICTSSKTGAEPPMYADCSFTVSIPGSINGP